MYGCPWGHTGNEVYHLLTLKNITKIYQTGDTRVEALKGIDLQFRPCEFAAILGPSGCGKTTLLNLIGGLDQYTEGDLIINGVSTKEYRDADWDTYRNHSVGFVFQSYNLIPHQSVLANVELALTLSGVSREERRKRALGALERVGLGDQVKKRPNQLSGGQMQRVAIARALVNDPEILLADEPTGALDSETSVQVMEILKEIARDRLVIMVTHNPELANEYATRIIRLLDGKVTSDSDPCDGDGKTDTPVQRQKKPSMSLATALNLSLNNLLTKKGRSLLTAFAGSIGIIGIALILSLSSGVRGYISRVEEETLSSYPLEIERSSYDMTDMMNSMTGMDMSAEEHEPGKVYSGSRMTKLMSSWMSGVTTNNLAPFKAYLDSHNDTIDTLVSGIQYEYQTPLTLFRVDEQGRPVQVNPSTALEATGMMSMISMMGGTSGVQQTITNAMLRRMNVFNALLDNPELLDMQYEVLAGRMPQAMDEVVIIVNSRNELSDYTLYTLGLKDQSELKGQFERLMQGEAIESEEMEFTYEELLNLRFRLLLNTDLYERQGISWSKANVTDEYLLGKLENSLEIRVVGILRPADGAVSMSSGGVVGYRFELMEYLLEQVKNSDIVREQLANPEIDVLTGQPFTSVEVDLAAELDRMSVSEFFEQYAGVMGIAGEFQQGIAQVPNFIKDMISKDTIRPMLALVNQVTVGNTLEQNLETFGVSDPEDPDAIYIYPSSFAAKEEISRIISDYNAAASEEDQIHYTDLVGLIISSVTTIINAISYVLIAFVAISLIVSSIMIGIITYISVLERTKEIGILRAIGASKRDISRVFNAETLILGFSAGILGILVTLGLTVIVNIIIHSLTGIPNISVLPAGAAALLVCISMTLTLIAGFIPARIAAGKDPVVALRTE